MNDDLIKRLRFCANLHPQFGYPENGKLFAEAAAALAEAQATIARLEAALIKWRSAIISAAFSSSGTYVEERRAVADAETELLELARAALSPREGEG